MRDENDDLKERMEDIVTDIKEGRIGCKNCKKDKGKGKEIPYIPVVRKEVNKKKIVEKESNDADVPTFKNKNGRFTAKKEVIMEKKKVVVGDKGG